MRAIAEQAVKEANGARQRVDALEKEATELIGAINAAIQAIDSATTESDRIKAKGQLAELQKRQAEMQARIAETKAQAARAERKKGAQLSKECQENPLAKGCS